MNCYILRFNTYLSLSLDHFSEYKTKHQDKNKNQFQPNKYTHLRVISIFPKLLFTVVGISISIHNLSTYVYSTYFLSFCRNILHFIRTSFIPYFPFGSVHFSNASTNVLKCTFGLLYIFFSFYYTSYWFSSFT